jgi:hypothetical protein
MNHRASSPGRRVGFCGIVMMIGFLLACQFVAAAGSSVNERGSAGKPWAKAAMIENSALRLLLAPESGQYEIQEKRGQAVWRSNPYRARFGEVLVKVDGQSRHFDLAGCDVHAAGSSLEARFHPLTNLPAAELRVRLQLLKDGKTVEFSYEADQGLAVESVRLLEDALWVTDAERGYVVAPVREGMLIPADSGLAFNQSFDTFAYEGCHMAMLGVVQKGAAALITWDDPYVAAEVKSVVTNTVQAGAKQVLSSSVVLRQSARSFRIRFCGPGDYVTLGQAYREIARQKGWLVTWDEKLKKHPQDAKLFGAINYKLWSTLTRQMNEASTQETRAYVSWTFDEAAQVAEHLKNDLKLDRVLFIMGGWIHRGYDNQHPDILPAAPECGGNDGLAQCSQRVRQLGYLFCLHDNYQDIYRDSPSWNTNLIMKKRDGSLAVGGSWAGGRAYLTCSQKALELAQRPQNLPAVKKLTDADAYFIDTTYAAGLQECFDPAHPLTRGDDLKWKQAISDYARDVFGIFGSECGREWAIPHSDFFEGLTGVSGHYYHDKALPGKLGAVVIPLFEIVYRDTIAMYGKYGYDFGKSAEYVLHHLAIGRPLNYHNIPAHLYWQQPSRSSDAKPADPLAPDAGVFTRADNGWAQDLHRVDRFVKNTYEMLSPLNELTARMRLTQHQFLTPDRKVQRTVFGTGREAVEVVVNAGAGSYRHQSKTGGEVVLPPYGFLIASPTFVAFHALSWNGLTYKAPVLFTLRSLDGQAITRSARVRIYHGFGDNRLQPFGEKSPTLAIQVTRESIWNMRTGREAHTP